MEQCLIKTIIKNSVFTINFVFAGAENALKHGAQGTFSWSNWTSDVAISASMVIIPMATSWATTSYLMLNAQHFTVESLGTAIYDVQIKGR